MECELRSLRQASQGQERTIQGLNESINTKDNEVSICFAGSLFMCVLKCTYVNLFLTQAQELYQLIEGQNATLCKLREMVQHNQLAQCKVGLVCQRF